jgi:hypothetical protein
MPYSSVGKRKTKKRRYFPWVTDPGIESAMKPDMLAVWYIYWNQFVIPYC